MRRRNSGDDEAGATAVEYGLLLAGIAAVIIATVTTVGNRVLAIFADTLTWPW